MNETSAVSGTNKELMDLPYSYFVNRRFLDSTFAVITGYNYPHVIYTNFATKFSIVWNEYDFFNWRIKNQLDAVRLE